MRKKLLQILTVLLIFGLTACTDGAPSGTDSEPTVLTDTAFKLDTLVTISLYDWEDEATLDLAFAEIDRLDQLLNVDTAGSDIERLYQNAGVAPVTVAAETMEVLQTAVRYAELSEGAFDPTIGPLVDLWNIRDGKGHIPTEDELAAAQSLIDYRQLSLTDDSAYLATAGMKVNLGAIAKGYIADKVKEVLLAEGVEHAVINLGGNVLTIGSRPDGTPFGIGIQDPFLDTGNVIIALTVDDESLVSSGTYQRFFEVDGVRYHHILDPMSGYPSDSGLTAVTIVSDQSIDGDALSTICMLIGEDAAMALIESMAGAEAVLIADDGTITLTDGLQGRVIDYEN